MNTVTAYATNPATGERVEVTYKSWANNLIDQYTRAASEIEKAHGFKPDAFKDVSLRVY